MRVAATAERLRRFGALIESPATIDPIAVEVATDLVPTVDPAAGSTMIPEQIPAMRERLREVLGFDVPGVRIREATFLAAHEYRILLFGITVAAGVAVPEHACLFASSSRLHQLGLQLPSAIDSHDPVLGGSCTWVAPDEASVPVAGDLPRVTDVGFVLRHLEDVVTRSASRFFGLDAAEQWIAAASAHAEVTSSDGDDERAASTRRLAIARCLRALVADGVRLDPELLGSVGAEIDRHSARSSERSNDVFQVVAATLPDLRLRYAQRLAGRVGAGPHVVPRRVQEVTATHGGLPAVEAHTLLTTLLPDPDVERRSTYVVDDEDVRPYLGRLIADTFGPIEGIAVATLSAAELGSDSSITPFDEDGDA